MFTKCARPLLAYQKRSRTNKGPGLFVYSIQSKTCNVLVTSLHFTFIFYLNFYLLFCCHTCINFHRFSFDSLDFRVYRNSIFLFFFWFLKNETVFSMKVKKWMILASKDGILNFQGLALDRSKLRCSSKNMKCVFLIEKLV